MFYELSGGLQCTEMKTIYVISIESASSKQTGGNIKKALFVFYGDSPRNKWTMIWIFFTACKVMVLSDVKGIVFQRYRL